MLSRYLAVDMMPKKGLGCPGAPTASEMASDSPRSGPLAASAFTQASDALFGAFDTVTHRVANQVSERFSDGVHETLVQICVLTAQYQSNILATLLGYVTHHAGETTEKLLHRHHTNFHYRTLQVAEHARLKRHRIAETSAQGFLGSMSGKFGECLLQHRPADDQFTDQIEHAIDAFGIDTQNIFRKHRMIVPAGGCMFVNGFRRSCGLSQR